MRRNLGFLICILIIVGIPWAGAAVADTDSTMSEAQTAASNARFWLGWTTPTEISKCPTDRATYPTLAVSGNGQTVHLAWTDGRAVVRNVYYATSAQRGDSWTEPQLLFATVRESWRPSLAISSKTPFVAWAETTSGLNHATFQAQLGADSRYKVPNYRSMLAYAPRLASGPGGELHIVLQGGTDTKPDILYSRRKAGESAWPAATRVFTHTASGSHNPAIAVSADGQTVHLVWQENFSGDESAIYYLRGQWDATDITWDTAVSLSGSITRSVRPSVVVDHGSPGGQTVYVAWGEQISGFEEQYVRFRRSTDGGETWGAFRRVSAKPFSANNVAPTDVAPSLVVVPDEAVCVAWHGFPTSASIQAEEVYLACSRDRGQNWSKPVNVSNSPNIISIRPVLAAGSDGILHLAWQELAGDDPVSEYQIYYAHSMPHRALLPIIQR